MRMAVLSDIHGNLGALEAVLTDAAQRGFDRIVNLGDICSGPLQPRETADRLIPLDLPTIRGNHERQVLTQAREDMGASDRYAAERLTAEQLQWFERLPESRRLGEAVLMVHGSPRSDVEYWLETVDPGGLRSATAAEVRDRAGDAEAEIILCGHTHLPRVVQIDGGPLVVNPGSVGLPAYEDDRPFPHAVETGAPHARYAIVEKRGGAWSVDLIAVGYDWDAAARAAAENGRPDWARALATGRL